MHGKTALSKIEDVPSGVAAQIKGRLSATLGEEVGQIWHIIMGMRENNPLTREDGIQTVETPCILLSVQGGHLSES